MQSLLDKLRSKEGLFLSDALLEDLMYVEEDPSPSEMEEAEDWDDSDGYDMYEDEDECSLLEEVGSVHLGGLLDEESAFDPRARCRVPSAVPASWNEPQREMARPANNMEMERVQAFVEKVERDVRYSFARDMTRAQDTMHSSYRSVKDAWRRLLS